MISLSITKDFFLPCMTYICVLLGINARPLHNSRSFNGSFFSECEPSLLISINEVRHREKEAL